MDLSNSVIIPREDFLELQEVAFNQHFTTSERVAGTLQAVIVMTALAGAVTAASWSWAKAMDWHDERKLRREAARQHNR